MNRTALIMFADVFSVLIQLKLLTSAEDKAANDGASGVLLAATSYGIRVDRGPAGVSWQDLRFAVTTDGGESVVVAPGESSTDGTLDVTAAVLSRDGGEVRLYVRSPRDTRLSVLWAGHSTPSVLIGALDGGPIVVGVAKHAGSAVSDTTLTLDSSNFWTARCDP